VAVSCTFQPQWPAGSKAQTTTGTGFWRQAAPLGVAAPKRESEEWRLDLEGRGRLRRHAPRPDGANCGLQTYGLQNIPPDLLIIEDKSGSMADMARR